MAQKLTHRESLLVIYLVNFLERFCYYGIRGIIVLYVINLNTFNVPNEDAFFYYSIFIMLVSVLTVPLGFLNDFFLTPKKGFLIGGFMAFLSYGLLLISNINTVFFSMILLACAMGFMRPSILVLLGQLYNKEDRKRNNGFITFFLTSNLGAFLSAIIISYISTEIGWNYGFLIVFFAMMIALSIFYNYQNRIHLVELEGTISTNQLTLLDIGDDKLLDDTFVEEKRFKIWKTNKGIVAFIILSYSLYWSLIEITTPSEKSVQIFQDFFTVTDGLGSGLYGGMVLLVGILLVLIGIQRDLGGTINKIGFAFIVLGIVIPFYNTSVIYDSFIYLIPISWLFLGLSEVIISTFLFSYLTRISNPKYACLTIGLAIFSSYILMKSIMFFNISIPHLVITGICIVVGICIFLFRKQFLALANGID